MRHSEEVPIEKHHHVEFVTGQELAAFKELLYAHVETVREMLRSRDQNGAERDRRYEERFTAMDEKTQLALTASKEAVNKAETATEKRFDSVNEFRATLSDQARTLMPRLEAEAKFISLEEKGNVNNGALEQKIEALRIEQVRLRDNQSSTTGEKIANITNREQTNWTFDKSLVIVAIVIAFGSFVVSAALLIFKFTAGK